MIAMRWTLLCCLGLFFIPGCSGSKLPPNARPTAPVKVTVTYKGAPVAEAVVTFVNQEGTPANAFGKTDAQGVAKMKTYIDDDGAVIGPHKVLITKTETQNAGKAVDQSSPDYAPPAGGGAPLPTVKNLIPQKYSQLGELKADVSAKGPNDFKFDLTD